MAKPSVDISLNELEQLAFQYITECVTATKEIATVKGAVNVKERHLPTIQYFLRIWLPIKGKPSIARSTYYDWLSQEDSNKSDTIKKIDDLFKALAEDVVANEGKGIFYAKNKLGMTDKAETTHKGDVSPFIPIDINVKE
ncbi:MAG: hypothetical protein HRU12_07365 [Phaeodactylibacter sp.]|nr:hypothetical protein [Phaeodactylibacter sp.]